MPHPLKISAADREALARVQQFLSTTIDEPPGIRQLCRLSGLNADKLKRGFKLIYGMPPYRYHLQVKMNEAKRLLSVTEKSVATIAFELGYEQVSAFCKTFKKEVGVTALDWRSRNAAT